MTSTPATDLLFERDTYRAALQAIADGTANDPRVRAISALTFGPATMEPTRDDEVGVAITTDNGGVEITGTGAGLASLVEMINQAIAARGAAHIPQSDGSDLLRVVYVPSWENR